MKGRSEELCIKRTQLPMEASVEFCLVIESARLVQRHRSKTIVKSAHLLRPSLGSVERLLYVRYKSRIWPCQEVID